MSSLRSQLIRLAHSKPQLRPHLLPLLKEAADKKETSSTALAEKVLKVMGQANGGKFTANKKDLAALQAALDKMVADGAKLTNTDEILELVDGDADEMDEKFGQFDGYSTVSELLTKIGGF